MKIAINKCYGGFSLNNEAAKLLKEKGVKITFNGEYYSDGSGPKETYGHEESHHLSNENFGINNDENYDAWRVDERLIEVIEKLGEENVGTRLSRIRIKEIPDDVEWYIDDYDGIETIHEAHRSW